MLEIDLSNVSEQTKVKYIEFVKQVKKLLQKYEEQDLEGLQQVKSKIEDTRGNWDIGIRLKYGDNAEKEIPISLLLAYEYCLATERITNRRVKFEEMLDKLFDGVQKFRIGNPVQGVDDECLYGKSLDDQTAIPIMTKQYRIKMPAGAQHLDYVKDGKPTSAVFIYAKESIPNFAIDSNTGEPKSFETDGIDFQELLGEISLLTCLRQTVFHEWNHNAEKEMISPNEQAIPEEYESIDGKKYKNYETKSQYVSAQGIAIQEPTTYYYDSKERKYYYVDLAGNRQYDVNFELRINQLDKKYYISTGMTTKEVMENGELRIHNQITEGFVEATARAMLLAIAPDTIDIDDGRYYEQVEMAKRVFLSRDMSIGEEGITYADFLMHSSRLKQDLESIEIDGKVDGLHYIGNYADKVKANMTPKRKMYVAMGQITQRLGIDVNEQLIKKFEKLNLFGKSSITEDEKEELKNLLLSGTNPDKSYVYSKIAELITYINDENCFFDEIPEKLGYREKEIITQDTQLAEK